MATLMSVMMFASMVCIAVASAAAAPRGRRIFVALLSVLLCAAVLAGIAAVALVPMLSGWMRIALVATVLIALLLPVYLIVHPPDFGDESDDDSGGGSKWPPPERPEPPTPHHGPPDPDWSSFDDLRRDWEREPVAR